MRHPCCALRSAGAMNVTSALIFGSIFWRMGLSQTSIQDRMGLLQVRQSPLCSGPCAIPASSPDQPES